MELYVLFGQRKQQYEGQYGFEALACSSEYDADENPDYMPEQMQKARECGDFDALAVVTLSVSAVDVRRILYPQALAIPASVTT